MKNKKKTKQPQHPYQGQKCAQCQVAFTETDEVLVCSDCGKAYHRQCWEDKGCVTADCTGKPDPEKSYSPKAPAPEPEESAPPQNPYAGKTCPYCHVAFAETDSVVVCGDCGVPLHKQCWADHGGCTTPGCSGQPTAGFPPEPAETPKKKHKIAPKLLGIYSGILLAACVVVGILFWQKILCFHQWQPATCIQPETCARCDKTRGEALGHDWLDADCVTPETCSRCGETQGKALGHDWKAADCTTPKTCQVCGETEGEALGHDWEAADCTTPKTCRSCGETEGEALGHDWKDADCTTPKTCKRCGETEGEALGHDWQEATYEAPKTCKRCGLTEGEPLVSYGEIYKDVLSNYQNDGYHTEYTVCDINSDGVPELFLPSYGYGANGIMYTIQNDEAVKCNTKGYDHTEISGHELLYMDSGKYVLDHAFQGAETVYVMALEGNVLSYTDIIFSGCLSTVGSFEEDGTYYFDRLTELTYYEVSNYAPLDSIV